MAGKISTVGDLLEAIEFLDSDCRVRSENGKPLWVGITRVKNFKGNVINELVIHGELKEVTRNTAQINHKKELSAEISGGRYCPYCKRNDTATEVLEGGMLKFICDRCEAEI